MDEDASGKYSEPESPVSQKMPVEMEKSRGWEYIGLCGDL